MAAQSDDTSGQGHQPRIPAPPSKADVDQISRDQALIADEWAPTPEIPSNSAADDEAS